MSLGKFLKSHLRGWAILFGMLLLTWFALGVLADRFVDQLPDDFTTAIFSQTVLPEGTAPPPKLLKDAFNKIIEGSEKRNLNYEIYLIKSDFVNAYVEPGGKIFITSKLHESINSEIGLAMVIAHELGHLQFRDGMRQTARRILLAGVVYGISDISLVGTGILGLSFSFFEIKYSRIQEKRADLFALKLVKEKYGTLGDAFEFYYNIHNNSVQESPQRKGSWLSTHPAPRDRIEYLEKAARQAQN
jgi:Zn-dependent protease with chaperone function